MKAPKSWKGLELTVIAKKRQCSIDQYSTMEQN